MIPGELFTEPGEHLLNTGRLTLTLVVRNTGDRPIQVGSHYHFFETNPGLKFDRDKARGSRSQSVCQGCAFCLSHLSLRLYSILATEHGLRHPTRAEIRELLLEPPEPPFVLCIAVSGQKHLHFRSQVAYSRDGYPVQMEETRVCVERLVLRQWLEKIEMLYTVFSKDEIRTGRYSQNRIKEFGLLRFQAVEAMIAPSRGTRLFDLAVFVAQKTEVPAPEPEEKEEPCITTSTPTIPPGQLQLF